MSAKTISDSNITIISTGPVNLEEIPERVIVSLAPLIMEATAEYFKDPAVIRKFIVWHEKRYNCLPSDIDSLNAALEATKI